MMTPPIPADMALRMHFLHRPFQGEAAIEKVRPDALLQPGFFS
jgi:hypothetical protein